jgi:hypothetical protein
MLTLKNTVTIVLGALVMTLGILVMSPGAMADQQGVPLPMPAKAYKGEKCVEPADVMRREHMEFLKHQRDETMREGIRGNKYGLQQCVDCHAVADPKIAGGKIRTLKPFCAECHSYAAVSVDCFSCHNPTAPLDKSSAIKNVPLDKMIAAHLGKKAETKQ